MKKDTNAVFDFQKLLFKVYLTGFGEEFFQGAHAGISFASSLLMRLKSITISTRIFPIRQPSGDVDSKERGRIPGWPSVWSGRRFLHRKRLRLVASKSNRRGTHNSVVHHLVTDTNHAGVHLRAPFVFHGYHCSGHAGCDSPRERQHDARCLQNALADYEVRAYIQYTCFSCVLTNIFMPERRRIINTQLPSLTSLQ